VLGGEAGTAAAALAVSVVIVGRHADNIRRLRRGEEK
jgi:glycerol-3-phosphate acyltransferase PlsY